MAYSTNPNLIKARATALQLLVRDQKPVGVVARQCGIHRTTVWRWKRKWNELNKNVQLENNNRPTRISGSAFRQAAWRWQIVTVSSRPTTSPKAISAEVIALVLQVRQTLKRCAEVVWHHLVHILHVAVSLSSVRRILRRHHCFDGARKNRIRSDNPRRPRPTYPGELVQTDTIHHAAWQVQAYLRQGDPGLYVCQLDISKYYASINHGRLLELLTDKIADPEVLRLLEIIIDSTDSGTEHDGLFAPDSPYFTKGRRGIPIGNLTSQLFANVYLHRADMYAKQTLKIRGYVRYMDDILFFHHDKSQLHAWKAAMIDFLHDDLFLTANPRKTRLYPTRHGVDFVGYVIYPQAMRLRGSSVRRFKKRYRKQLESVMNGRTDPEVMRQSFNSWKAHAAHAKSEKLVEKLEGLQGDALFVRSVLRIYHNKRQKEAARASRQLSLFERE